MYEGNSKASTSVRAEHGVVELEWKLCVSWSTERCDCFRQGNRLWLHSV